MCIRDRLTGVDATSLAAAALSYKSSLVVEQHHALFRHVADRIAWALAADAAVLYAAISELVGAPGRTAIDDHSTGSQASNSAYRQFGRVRENAGLQPKSAIADGAEDRVDVVIGQQADDRPEHLIAHHLHGRLAGIDENPRQFVDHAGRLRRRLENQRISGRDRGRDLVAGQIHRRVERSY